MLLLAWMASILQTYGTTARCLTLPLAQETKSVLTNWARKLLCKQLHSSVKALMLKAGMAHGSLDTCVGGKEALLRWEQEKTHICSTSTCTSYDTQPLLQKHAWRWPFLAEHLENAVSKDWVSKVSQRTRRLYSISPQGCLKTFAKH